jgi:membrane-bound ClpP family serine protease
VTPNRLLVLFFAGILAIYGAVILPRTSALGFVGIGCTLAALYMAPVHGIEPSGLIVLGAATLLYGLELVWKVNYIAGITGAILLPIGFVRLYSGQQQISSALAIPLGLTLGLATAVFCRTAKRARINKTSGL